MPNKVDFEKVFNPQSVAFIGASKEGGFIPRYKDLGFKGRIYPVNPKLDEIVGFKAYPSIGAIPETVDYAIISVPARVVPQILTECADAGVDHIHIFTAGFSETGRQEGIELETQIREIANKRGLHIIGPNGMGVYNPKTGMVSWSGAPKGSGPVAFISQSGSLSFDCCDYGWNLGVLFSKIVSMGNGTVLDSTDYLEYFASDPETKMIGMYLEGVRDGRKLTQLVKVINPRKPVIIMKGGLTESGARAATSHTGSLAGSEAVWSAFFKQTGAVKVDTTEELMDMAMVFHYMRPLHGRRLAVIVGNGGGMSVSSADACAREGFVVPALAAETQRKLQEYVQIAGASVGNPLDILNVFGDTGEVQKTLDLVAADPAIDGVLIVQNADILNTQAKWAEEKRIAENFQCISAFARSSSGKPVAVVIRARGHGADAEKERVRQQTMLAELELAVFPTIGRAATALRRFADYHQFLG